MNIAELYDSNGASAYAVALRITRDPIVAEATVRDVFKALDAGMELPGTRRDAGLLRAVRDLALARRETRTALPSVLDSSISPRALVEAAFFEGADTAELAQATSVPVAEIRRKLCDGMAELRSQLARMKPR